MPNASAAPMPTHQRFMTQPGYVSSMMMPNYQPSAGPTPMNVNNGWMLGILNANRKIRKRMDTDVAFT